MKKYHFNNLEKYHHRISALKNSIDGHHFKGNKRLFNKWRVCNQAEDKTICVAAICNNIRLESAPGECFVHTHTDE